MFKYTQLVLIGIVSLVGCKSTPTYRQVSHQEIPAYKQAISDISPAEYRAEWIQPGNKNEKCEVMLVSYDFAGKPKNTITSQNIHWDGQCRNGKTHGLGKLSMTSGGIEGYEIAYHDGGIAENFYYREVLGSNVVAYGAYSRDGDKFVKRYEVQGSINSNGDIGFNYAYVEVDNINSLTKGVLHRKYNDGGVGKYTGILGNKLFFGTREFFNSANRPTGTFWGYANMSTEKPESYVALQNQQGLFHQYYEYGNLVEYVQLPSSYTQEIMKVSSDAASIALKASNAGQLALAMKKRYDQSYVNAPTDPAPEESSPELHHSISTGTGFFVSNDGYLLTNSHVVHSSSKITVILNEKSVSATIVDQDPSNDIALLKINRTVKGLPIELKSKIKKGSDIAVLGYPNIGLQGNNQKATFGFINANSGLQGDTRYYQISAPIQPGNSGSPMFNDKGVVIGIASASLNQDAALKATGTLAQNVNYAVKIAYALPMLVNHGVGYIEAPKQRNLSKTSLIEKVSPSVVLVVAE